MLGALAGWAAKRRKTRVRVRPRDVRDRENDEASETLMERTNERRHERGLHHSMPENKRREKTEQRNGRDGDGTNKITTKQAQDALHYVQERAERSRKREFVCPL